MLRNDLCAPICLAGISRDTGQPMSVRNARDSGVERVTIGQLSSADACDEHRRIVRLNTTRRHLQSSYLRPRRGRYVVHCCAVSPAD
jgi:hypothetical protein